MGFDIHKGFHDVAIVGLEFYAAEKDPESPEFNPQSGVKSAIGVFISSKYMACGRRLLVEDCSMRFCGASFQIAQDRRNSLPEPVSQLVFRRNLVLDNYSRTSHCQGTYAAAISILLEENIYDHNGWLVQESGNRKDRGGATIFNHNVRIAENVFCGGPVHFVQNTDRLQDITFCRNTLLMPWQERQLVRAEGDLSGCTFSGNIYSSTAPDERWFGCNGQDLSFDEWIRRTEEPGATVEARRTADQQRSIERYMAHLGLEPTFEAFIGEVRKQSKANWRPEFSAAVVNDWIRLGFASYRHREQ